MLSKILNNEYFLFKHFLCIFLTPCRYYYFFNILILLSRCNNEQKCWPTFFLLFQRKNWRNLCFIMAHSEFSNRNLFFYMNILTLVCQNCHHTFVTKMPDFLLTFIKRCLLILEHVFFIKHYFLYFLKSQNCC